MIELFNIEEIDRAAWTGIARQIQAGAAWPGDPPPDCADKPAAPKPFPVFFGTPEGEAVP